MRCAYPRCFHEASARCATCRRLYCTEHCSDWLSAPGHRLQECELCAQHLPPEPVRSRSYLRTLADVGAVAVFLVAVGVGVAIDVSARGAGFVALWVCAAAFLGLVTCVYR